MLHSGHGSIPHILAPMVCLCESTTHEDGAIMHDDTLVASNFASGVQLLQHELSVSCVYRQCICGSVMCECMLCARGHQHIYVERLSYLRMTLILETTHS